MKVIMKTLPAVFILILLASPGQGQKKPHPDEYLYNEIVTIKGKVTIFYLREDSKPNVGNQWGLIFQRAACKKCFVYVRTDNAGNYQLHVGRGRYRVISRIGIRLGELVDVL